VSTVAHQKLALEAALQGAVLMKNQGPGKLPWRPSDHQVLAVVGPHANAHVALLGNYYGLPPDIISPVKGLSRRARSVKVANGCGQYSMNGGIVYDSVDCSTPDLEAVRSAVKDADAVVAVLGLDQAHSYATDDQNSAIHGCGPGQEGEDCDRTSLNLPKGQLDVLQAAQEAAGSAPVVVVLLSGGAVDVHDLLEDKNVAAVLWLGYPGQAGGEALARLLYGEVSPSGRLPMTWYPESFAETVDFLDLRLHPAAGHLGRTYRFYTGVPVMPFGHGLSYTTFDLRILSPELRILEESLLETSHQLSAMRVTAQASEADSSNTYRRESAMKVAEVDCEARNSGDRAGEVVLLLFISSPGAGNKGRPIRTLVGFARTAMLAPGDSERVTFAVTASDLSVLREDGVREAVPGTWALALADGDVDHGASLELV